MASHNVCYGGLKSPGEIVGITGTFQLMQPGPRRIIPLFSVLSAPKYRVTDQRLELDRGSLPATIVTPAICARNPLRKNLETQRELPHLLLTRGFS